MKTINTISIGLISLLFAVASIQAAEPPATSAPKTEWQNITADLSRTLGVDAGKPEYDCNMKASIVFPNGDLGVAVTKKKGFYVSRDQGATWTKSGTAWLATGQSSDSFKNFYPNRTALYMENGSIAVSQDNGTTWTAEIKGKAVPGSSFGYFDYGDMDLLDNIPPKTIIGRNHHPDYQERGAGMLSTDGGTSWNWAPPPLRHTWKCRIGVVNASTLLRGQAQKDVGNSEQAPGIYLSTNLGQAWTKVADYTLTGYVPTHYGPNLYWAAKEGVVVSRDGGKTWSVCGSSPADVTAGPYFGTNEREMMVVVLTGTKTGYHLTRDGGKTWTVVPFWQPPDGWGVIKNPNSYGWDAGKNILYASRMGGNVWKLQLGSTPAAR